MDLSRKDVDRAYAHVTDHKAAPVDRETFGERLRDAYAELIEVARDGATITYRELGDYLGVHRRGEIRTVLEGIAFIEHRNNRPPLTVVVVKSSTQKPDVGFFDTVDRLNLRDNYHVVTDAELVAMMATNVYAEWQPVDA